MIRQNWTVVIIRSRCPAAKQVISRRRKNENVNKMSKDEKCTCKACKNPVFHCQICKFVGFLLPSSSWLLKLPHEVVPRSQSRRELKETGSERFFSFFVFFLRPCVFPISLIFFGPWNFFLSRCLFFLDVKKSILCRKYILIGKETIHYLNYRCSNFTRRTAHSNKARTHVTTLKEKKGKIKSQSRRPMEARRRSRW